MYNPEIFAQGFQVEVWGCNIRRRFLFTVTATSLFESGGEATGAFDLLVAP